MNAESNAFSREELGFVFSLSAVGSKERTLNWCNQTWTPVCFPVPGTRKTWVFKMCVGAFVLLRQDSEIAEAI